MRKQLFALLFAASLVCCLCACGSGGDSGDTSSNSPPTTHDGTVGSGHSDSDKPTDNLKNLTAFERLFANGSLPAQDTNELWGYIDNSGNWTISPVFAEARGFRDSGLALAKDVESQLWGLINTSGQYVVAPTFDNIGRAFGDGLFRVHIPERGWGYIDTSGAFVIEPQFDDANDFSNGFARVSSAIQYTNQGQNYYQLWGYINTSGERITEDIFPEAYDFSDGLACVKVGDFFYGFYGYIDTIGDFVILADYDKATSFCDGRAFVHEPAAGAYDETWIMIDTEENWLADGWFDISTSNGYAVYWNYDLAPVRLRDGTGYVYINKNGEHILPKSGEPYDNASIFSGEYAVATNVGDTLYGYIDLEGNWAISPQYVAAGNFIGGLAYVATAMDTAGIIDTSGNCLLTLDVRASVGSLRAPERIAVTLTDSDGVASKTGFWSISDGMVIDYIYDAAGDFAADYSYAKVKYDGLWGIIDKDGNWLIPAQFLSLG